MLNNLNGYISSFPSRNLTVLNVGDLDVINSQEALFKYQFVYL